MPEYTPEVQQIGHPKSLEFCDNNINPYCDNTLMKAASVRYRCESSLKEKFVEAAKKNGAKHFSVVLRRFMEEYIKQTDSPKVLEVLPNVPTNISS
jgi:hypothetical protein